MKAFLVALLAAVLCAQQGKELQRLGEPEERKNKEINEGQEGLAASLAAAEVLVGFSQRQPRREIFGVVESSLLGGFSVTQRRRILVSHALRYPPPTTHS